MFIPYLERLQPMFRLILAHTSQHVVDSSVLLGAAVDQLTFRVGITAAFVLFVALTYAMIRDIRRDIANDRSNKKGSAMHTSYPPADWQPTNGSGYSFRDPSRETENPQPRDWQPSDATTVNSWNVNAADLFIGQPRNQSPMTVGTYLYGFAQTHRFGISEVTTWDDIDAAALARLNS